MKTNKELSIKIILTIGLVAIASFKMANVLGNCYENNLRISQSYFVQMR